MSLRDKETKMTTKRSSHRFPSPMPPPAPVPVASKKSGFKKKQEDEPAESSSSSSSSPARAISAPGPPAAPSEVKLKTQISAPSYFHSLSSNDLPPFKIPKKEPRPCILISIDPLVTKDDIVVIIASYEAEREKGLARCLGRMLAQKKVIDNYALVERNFLISFLSETIAYGARHDFRAFKLSVLFTIYLTTHMYFKWYYWKPPEDIWNYFKELMIRHTIEDTPDGQEVFDPDECYDIVTHFHTMYMSNLPLIHILSFGVYRLNFAWPFKPSGKK